MRMEYRISSFNAAIDLKVEDYSLIDATESFNTFRYGDRPVELEQKLSKLPGVSQVEYNGHFGPSIFFRLDCEETDSVDPFAIGEVIKEHVKECKKFLKKHGLMPKMEKT